MDLENKNISRVPGISGPVPTIYFSNNKTIAKNFKNRLNSSQIIQ